MEVANRDLVTLISRAFALESMVAERYSYFANIAEIEGHSALGSLFAQLTETGDCIAHGHLDVLRDVEDPVTSRQIGATELNTVAAIESELTLAELYETIAEVARENCVEDVGSWSESLLALKRVHVESLRRGRSESANMVTAEFSATRV